MSLETIVEDLSYLDDWNDRYRYLIDLGRNLGGLPEADKTEDNRVHGCMSRVWLTARPDPSDASRLLLQGDSDAHIVRGLVALVLAIFADKTAEQVLRVEVQHVFAQLGLDQHLSPSRSNGLHAVVQRIRALAQQQLAQQQITHQPLAPDQGQS